MVGKFGERLKELRTERGIGQVELSRAVSVSRGIISLWENSLREPTLSSLWSLARYFDVSIDFLTGFKDYP
jgi:transcriptional regulator with XRE-family HTH domain